MPKTIKIVINPSKFDYLSFKGNSVHVGNKKYVFGVDIAIGRTSLETLKNAEVAIPKSKVLEDGKTLEVCCDDCISDFTSVEN